MSSVVARLSFVAVALMSSITGAQESPSPPSLEIDLLPVAVGDAGCEARLVLAKVTNSTGDDVFLDRGNISRVMWAGTGQASRGHAIGSIIQSGLHGGKAGIPLYERVGLSPGASLLIPVHLPSQLIGEARVADRDLPIVIAMRVRSGGRSLHSEDWKEARLKATANVSLECQRISSPASGFRPGRLRLEVMPHAEFEDGDRHAAMIGRISNRGPENVFVNIEMIRQVITIGDGDDAFVSTWPDYPIVKHGEPTWVQALDRVVGLIPGGEILLHIGFMSAASDPSRHEPQPVPVTAAITLKAAGRLGESAVWEEEVLEARGMVAAVPSRPK